MKTLGLAWKFDHVHFRVSPLRGLDLSFASIPKFDDRFAIVRGRVSENTLKIKSMVGKHCRAIKREFTQYLRGYRVRWLQYKKWSLSSLLLLLYYSNDIYCIWYFNGCIAYGEWYCTSPRNEFFEVMICVTSLVVVALASMRVECYKMNKFIWITGWYRCKQHHALHDWNNTIH